MNQLHEYIREKKNLLLEQELSKAQKYLNTKDEDGRTPLMWALSEAQDLETVSVVLKVAREYSKFDIDISDEAGYTALHIAASLGSSFVSQLLPFNPTIDAKTNNRQTPLFLAVSKRHLDAAKLLLEHKASPKTKDIRQVTILQRAAAMGSEKLVALLLDAGAPVNATDINGWTALHYAYAEDHLDIARILEERGADKYLESRDGQLPQAVAPRKY